jgi:hypothetical protein
MVGKHGPDNPAPGKTDQKTRAEREFLAAREAWRRDADLKARQAASQDRP